MDNAEQDKALISRIATEIWNQGKLSVCDEIMTADAKYHGPHMPNGIGSREDWKRAIGMYRKAFPDSNVSFEELIVAGNIVIGRWCATGTHTGQLPAIEKPSGKKIDISGITIYHIAKGKIVEAWEQLDLLGMWRQLGIVNIPGGR